MKFSNFEIVEIRGSDLSDRSYVAEVDVTTGIFSKKTERKRIHRKYAGYWFFEDTGKFTPIGDVEDLARAYSAKTGKES